MMGQDGMGDHGDERNVADDKESSRAVGWILAPRRETRRDGQMSEERVSMNSFHTWGLFGQERHPVGSSYFLLKLLSSCIYLITLPRRRELLSLTPHADNKLGLVCPACQQQTGWAFFTWPPVIRYIEGRKLSSQHVNMSRS